MTIRDSIIAAIAEHGPLTFPQIAAKVTAGSTPSLRVAISGLVSDGKLARSSAKWRGSYSLPDAQP